MICPKCKTQISDNVLKCPNCGFKTGSYCKKCHAFNPILNKVCTNCKNVLLKVCGSCGAINLPSVEICRKCASVFVGEIGKCAEGAEIVESEGSDGAVGAEIAESEDVDGAEEPEEAGLSAIQINSYTRQEAKNRLIEALHDDNARVVSLSGASGCGKTLVLKVATNELKSEPFVWFYSKSTNLSQLTPCGLIQDMLLMFFNIPDFCQDILKLKKNSFKFFHQEFPNLQNNEIFDLLNFLYPTNSSFYENIYANKEKTFAFLKKIFEKIIDASNVVFVIDGFDKVDGMSYEFLSDFFYNSVSVKNIKIILTYDEIKPVRAYFNLSNLADIAYVDIPIGDLSRAQMESFLMQSSDEALNFSNSIKEQIYAVGRGNPARLEQSIALALEGGRTSLPATFGEVVGLRLDNLKSKSSDAYVVLMCAAILGVKFYPQLIMLMFNSEEGEFAALLDILVKDNFISPVSDIVYEFKNTPLWEEIARIIKTRDEYKTLCERLFDLANQLTLSSRSLCAVIAQNLNQKLSALEVWTDNIRLSAYIGDVNLYVISQKQCLTLVDELDSENSSLIKNNIFERLGKLLTKINPTDAINYLPMAIENAKKLENPIKEIELAGYLADCCRVTGNYYGAIECVDSAVAKLDYDFELEIAMFKTRNADLFLSVGNCAQAVNLIDTEIMGVFEKYIDNSKPHKNISINSLYESWLKTYLKLATALVYQGNNRAFEVLASLFEIIEKNNLNDAKFICKTKLMLAFAHTMKGDVPSSEMVLDEILKTYRMEAMDNPAILQWNFINIINNFKQAKYDGLSDELFKVVEFANNISDEITKNFLKTLLGLIFVQNEQAKHALDIYAEQVTYFAQTKNSLGALLSWYLIANSTLVVQGPDSALEIAQKALEVAQNPRINNYYFIVLLNKVMAESYMALSDFESAKIHIEKAIMVARKFDILDLLAELYVLYGKYLQDLAIDDVQVDYVVGASKMFKKSFALAHEIKSARLIKEVEKANAVLNSFCQLNSIDLK